MTPNYLLFLFCATFSFFCALIKNLYEAKYYPKNLYVFLMDVLLSAVCGIIVVLLLSAYIKSELTLIGVSGLGGMLGLSGLKSLIKFKLGKKIQIQFVDDDDDDSGININLNKNDK